MAAPNSNSLQAPPKNDEFITTKIPDNQGEISLEFLSSDILGLKFHVMRYFEGNSECEVERHFKKAFYSVSMTNNGRNIGEANSLPMRQRKLPASFWRQDLGMTSRTDRITNDLYCQPHTQCSYTGLDFQHTTQLQNNYTTTTAIGQLQNNYITNNTIGQFQGPITSQYRYSEAPLVGNQPAVSSRLISYSKLPMPVMSAPGLKVTHAQMDARPRCSIPDTTAVYYTRGPTTGHGFNPRYNSLLIQPDVILQLPLVHGQSRETSAKKG